MFVQEIIKTWVVLPSSYCLYCCCGFDKSVGVDESITASRSTIVVPGCDVCRIMCLIKSSWFFETTPHSKQGNSESKYFLCGCVNVYCCVTAVVWVGGGGGSWTWYWCSVDGVNGGKRIWCDWNRCWRNTSVFAKISLHDEQEYWICGMIVVTVCGVVWMEICEEDVGACDVWWIVEDSDGNGWSKIKFDQLI